MQLFFDIKMYLLKKIALDFNTEKYFTSCFNILSVVCFSWYTLYKFEVNIASHDSRKLFFIENKFPGIIKKLKVVECLSRLIFLQNLDFYHKYALNLDWKSQNLKCCQLVRQFCFKSTLKTIKIALPRMLRDLYLGA